MDVRKIKRFRNVMRWFAFGCLALCAIPVWFFSCLSLVSYQHRKYDRMKYGPSIREYRGKIQPGMTEKDIKNLFPQDKMREEQQLGGTDVRISMIRFSDKKATKLITFSRRPGDFERIEIFFDSDSVLVGYYMVSSD